MCLFTKWTPYGFEKEYVKVGILFHFIEIVNRKLVFVVSEGAHITVATALNSIRVRLTEL